MKSRLQRNRFSFGPEPLESREMLSASRGLAASHAASLAGSRAAHSQVQHVSSSVAGASASREGGCHGQVTTSLTATLTDPANSAVTGNVTYTSSTASGTANRSFNLSVSGAAANTALDVTIGGTVVGQIMTDATGAGSISFATNPTGTQQAFPTNFPTTLNANSVITVGTLSGTLASTSVARETTLTAPLTDSAGTATGTATFKSHRESGKTKLSVTVNGAAANSTLDVTVNGTVIGQVTTDANGAGTVKLKNPSLTISSGSTINVGTLSGTFATSTSSGKSSGHIRHFEDRDD